MTRVNYGKAFGIASVVLSLAFWIYAESGIGPNAFTESPYVSYLFLPGLLVIAALLSLAAAIWGTKLWLIAMIGPVAGALLLFTARV